MLTEGERVFHDVHEGLQAVVNAHFTEGTKENAKERGEGVRIRAGETDMNFSCKRNQTPSAKTFGGDKQLPSARTIWGAPLHLTR